MRFNATQVAGQAVLEGVLMRTDEAWAVAVRRPTGEVVVRRRTLPTRDDRPWLGQLPLLRGLVAFFDAVFLGGLALWFSLLQAGGDLTLATADVGAEQVAPQRRTGARATFWALGVGTLMAPLVLVLLPATLDAWCAPSFSRLAEGGAPRLARALAQTCSAVFQLGTLPAYVAALAKLPPLRRLRGYHAAEHKVRAAYAAGARLTLSTVRRQPVDAGDCTLRLTWSFAGVVTVAFAFAAVALPGVPPPVDVGATGQLVLCTASTWLRLVLLLPAMAVSYELRRWRRGRAGPPSSRGLAVTFAEPEPAMLEVALAALLAVLGGEAARDDGREPMLSWRRLGGALPSGTPSARLRRRPLAHGRERTEASCCTS